MSATRWYRVDDGTQGQTVLIEACSGAEAARIYLSDYAPDITVSLAEPRDINDWQDDVERWDQEDQSHIWHH